MPGVRIALAAGLALMGIAIGLTLLRSPASVAGTNRIAGQEEEPIGSTDQSARYCQAREALPRGTSAIRVWLYAARGPRVSVVVSSHGRTLTSGAQGSGWTGGSVTVPVKPLSRAVSHATVCVSFRLRDETVFVQGNATPAAFAAHDGGQALAGRIWIEYLRPGGSSWASLAGSIARRMGFGRAAAGTWVAFLALALLATVAALASSLVLRELR
jgi:hypothetical protein